MTRNRALSLLSLLVIPAAAWAQSGVENPASARKVSAPAADGSASEKKASAPAGEKKGSGEKKSGGASAKGGRGGSGQAQAVEVTMISRRDLTETLRVVGSIGSNETASIRPEMVGIIREINFVEGRNVKKGELLVKIDDSELAAQLAQSRARFELAKQNLTRAESLQQTQSNTQADVDRAKSEYAAAQADVDLLLVRLARTEIRAPFDGFVGSRVLSPGDYVNTQSIITTINDLSRLKAEFQVPERYITKVRKGTSFAVKSTTSGEEIATQGEVYFVSSVIDRNTRSSEVKGYLTKPSSALQAGMFAVIELVLEVRKGALAVPEGAIFVDQRGPQLVMVRELNGDKVAAFVPVKLGLRAKGLVEITAVEGKLDERQMVVGSGVGALALYSGAKLETRPLRAEFRIDN